MATIKQGTITSLTTSGQKNIKANVTDVNGIVMVNAVIPEHLRTINVLNVGVGVAIGVFDDNTSLIIGRLDGFETVPSE